MNSIQGEVFQKNNARPCIGVVVQGALQSIDMLLSQRDHQICLKHVWDIINPPVVVEGNSIVQMYRAIVIREELLEGAPTTVKGSYGC
ncbi:hypothetical protein TNCV_2830791 [Trichonephila clavipes]|nr:hypothetical protein TNCV_2830791 [Trichonephila clavipes]